MALDAPLSDDDGAGKEYESGKEERAKPSSNKKKRKRTTSSGGESILANTSIKKSPEVTKKKKKKLFKDVNAPNKPLNPYVLFLNKARESVRVANPDAPFAEVTRILAAKWTGMDEEQKKPYLEAAAKDRERYSAAISVYRETDNYRKFLEAKKNHKLGIVEKSAKKGKDDSAKNAKKHKSKRRKKDKKRSFSPLPPYEFKSKKSTKSGSNDADAKPMVDSSDIPIFTEAFLDHNKLQESELRRLRKQTMDYEEANAILSKHIDNVSATENKLSDEINQLNDKNKLIADHLTHLNSSLLTLFTGTSFSLVNTFIKNQNNGSPLSLDSMESLINFIESNLTSQDNSSSSDDKENFLLRKKLTQLMESVCKNDKDTCTETESKI